VQWLGAMSVRVGAPAHRVMQVLLDNYADRLPADLRRRLDEQLLRSERKRPH
jgi:hypothetical protein